MPRFSLHAIGHDRPGIVAALAAQLAQIGCNLEDSRMTILGGQFAVMVVIEVPTPDGSAIERVLEPVAEEFNLFLAVRPLPESRAPRVVGARVEVSVDGADHPGIVARMTAEAATRDANIVELISRRSKEDGRAAYVMELHLELTDPASLAELSEALERAARELEVRCTLRTTDAR